MPVCPRCAKAISDEALSCPHCTLPLKAHGHPGMTLHRAEGSVPLCDTCVYDADDSCNFPKRPKATSCTLYQDISHTNKAVASALKATYRIPWWRKYSLWLALAGLFGISLLVALL